MNSVGALHPSAESITLPLDSRLKQEKNVNRQQLIVLGAHTGGYTKPCCPTTLL